MCPCEQAGQECGVRVCVGDYPNGAWHCQRTAPVTSGTVANLPGRATHLGEARLACGLVSSTARRSTALDRVDCRACLRTKAARAAGVA
jgi:hypothetical protein